MPTTSTFYRKYRPQTFADVIGQKHIVQTLTNALKLGRVGQAYLFTGPRGTGKTTLARLFAKAINCSKRKGSEPCNKCEHCLLMAEGRSLDVIEIDAASHTGVDNIRELRETVQLSPTLGSHKIYIIDEVHMLSIGAFNALLKTLEEPPLHAVFILATTALHKVPDTIVSRCQRFDLSRFPVKSIIEKLTKIAKTEKLNIDHGALEMIALTAEGGMRDAESLLMQITSLEESPITEDKVIEALGTTKKGNIAALLRLIGNNELYPSLSFVGKLSQDGVDTAVFSGALLHYLRDLLLVSADPIHGPDELDTLTDEQKATLRELATMFAPVHVVRMLEAFQIAQRDSKTSVIPELPLQIAIVKILADNDQQSTTNKKQETGAGQQSDNKQRTTKNSEQQKENGDISIAASPKATETVEAHETNIELDTVREHWKAILSTAKDLNASLTLALSTAYPIATAGSTITIAVRYPFHKERLETTANQLTLRNAFDTILKSKVKLTVVLETSASEPSQKIQAKNEVTDTKHPLINQALELLGGRVITTENN